MKFNWNKIYFYNKDKIQTKKPPFKKAIKDITRILEFISINEEGNKRLSVGIHFVDSKNIKELNNEFRKKNSSTDVLSFPHNEYDDKKRYYIGDIFINEDIVVSQAKEIESDPLTEVKFLTMHGMLHLVGYDHMNEKEDEEMTSKQRLIFRTLGIRND